MSYASQSLKYWDRWTEMNEFSHISTFVSQVWSRLNWANACSRSAGGPSACVIPCSFHVLQPSPFAFVLIRHKSLQREIKTKRCLIIHLFFQICFYLGQCFPGWDVAEMGVSLGWFWQKISKWLNLIGNVPNGGVTTKLKQQLFTRITV